MDTNRKHQATSVAHLRNHTFASTSPALVPLKGNECIGKEVSAISEEERGSPLSQVRFPTELHALKLWEDNGALRSAPGRKLNFARELCKWLCCVQLPRAGAADGRIGGKAANFSNAFSDPGECWDHLGTLELCQRHLHPKSIWRQSCAFRCVPEEATVPPALPEEVPLT